MKLLGAALLVLTVFIGYGNAQQSCHTHAVETCIMNSDQWTDGSTCNAVYGNILGNKQNLAKLMQNHLKQSFQFIPMVKYKVYSSAEFLQCLFTEQLL